MVLLPSLYYKNVQSITIEDLSKHNIKGIAIDVDNTLIDMSKILNQEVIDWVNYIKHSGIKMCILSNSNKKDKITKVSNDLGIDYIMYAKKPLKIGFKKLIKKINLPPKNIAMIGDQIFTDVLGANIMKMFSIYVEPISPNEYWYTKWKRPLEAFVLKFRREKEEE